MRTTVRCPVRSTIRLGRPVDLPLATLSVLGISAGADHAALPPPPTPAGAGGVGGSAIAWADDGSWKTGAAAFHAQSRLGQRD